MYNTEIIYLANKSPLVDIKNIDKTNCSMCNKIINEGIESKTVLSGSFTNWSELKDRKSKYICKECSYCLKNGDFRINNIIADKNNMYLLKKNDLENYLFNLKDYISDEFVIGITTSFKKHNSFRCKVNSNTDCYFIRQEDKEYLFNAKELNGIYKILNEAYLQFSKDELQSGHYNLISMQQFGLEKFSEYENIFKKYRGTHQFNLLIYLMNSEKRNEYIKEKIKLEKELKKKDKVKK